MSKKCDDCICAQVGVCGILIISLVAAYMAEHQSDGSLFAPLCVAVRSFTYNLVNSYKMQKMHMFMQGDGTCVMNMQMHSLQTHLLMAAALYRGTTTETFAAATEGLASL